MTRLEHEFRMVIKKAMETHDFKRAQEAREAAAEHDIDLLDYLRHPALVSA